VALVLERDRRRTGVDCLDGTQLPEPYGVLHFVELVIIIQADLEQLVTVRHLVVRETEIK